MGVADVKNVIFCNLLQNVQDFLHVDRIKDKFCKRFNEYAGKRFGENHNEFAKVMIGLLNIGVSAIVGKMTTHG